MSTDTIQVFGSSSKTPALHRSRTTQPTIQEQSRAEGLGQTMPITSICLTIVVLSLLGLPLTVGFISKVFLLKAVFNHGNWPILFIIVFTSFLAMGYAWKIIEQIWMNEPVEGTVKTYEKPSLYIPMIILASLNIILGIYTYPIVNGSLQASKAIFWKVIS